MPSSAVECLRYLRRLPTSSIERATMSALNATECRLNATECRREPPSKAVGAPLRLAVPLSAAESSVGAPVLPAPRVKPTAVISSTAITTSSFGTLVLIASLYDADRRRGRSRKATATNIVDHGGSLQWRARGTTTDDGRAVPSMSRACGISGRQREAV